MPYDWKGNRGSDVTVAIRHRLVVYPPTG